MRKRQTASTLGFLGFQRGNGGKKANFSSLFCRNDRNFTMIKTTVRLQPGAHQRSVNAFPKTKRTCCVEADGTMMQHHLQETSNDKDMMTGKLRELLFQLVSSKQASKQNRSLKTESPSRVTRLTKTFLKIYKKPQTKMFDKE